VNPPDPNADSGVNVAATVAVMLVLLVLVLLVLWMSGAFVTPKPPVP
jgi:hypothetical protein